MRFWGSPTLGPQVRALVWKVLESTPGVGFILEQLDLQSGYVRR